MEPSLSDREAVRSQLGREPAPFRVATRCPFGLPSVVENEHGREMPTSFWVTCPSLKSDISRVEATGGVKAVESEVGPDEVSRVHDEHRRRYGSRVAGVGSGAAEDERVGRVKCLHAFAALHLAGALPNPIAEWTLQRLEKPYPKNACCTRPRAGA